MLLVGLISYFLITRSNTHFNTAYHEAMLRGAFRIVADVFVDKHQEEREQWFRRVQQHYGAGLQIRSADSLEWDGAIVPRDLAAGEVHIRRDFTGDTIYVIVRRRDDLDAGAVATVEIRNSHQKIKGDYFIDRTGGTK